MKVAQCLTHSVSGGGQQLVHDLTRVLQETIPDIEFSVLLPSGGVFVERFRELGVSVHQIEFNSLSRTVASPLAKALEAIQPDLIHTHGKGAGFHGRRSKTRAKRVHSFHGFYPPSGIVRRNLYLGLERRLCKSTDRFVLVSESEKANVVAALPAALAKSSVVYNVVDVQRVRLMATAEPDRAFKEFLDRNRGRTIIAMTGRTDPVKNHPLALNAAEALLNAGEMIAFVFIGLDPVFPQFRSLHAKYPSNVYAVLEAENVPAMLKGVQATMLTSRIEASAPLAISEGFALGKPSVGTNVPGIRDAIVDDVNGLLCAESPDALASQLRKLSRDAAYLRRLSEGANASAAKMDVKKWALTYYAIYNEVLAA